MRKVVLLLSISSTPASQVARKQRPTRPLLRRLFHYDGRTLAAVVEARADGWRVTDPKGAELGIFPSREFAIAFINAHIASPPSAAIAGERDADLQRLKTIREHRKRERAQRQERKRGAV
jgi:hypothetical protein